MGCGGCWSIVITIRFKEGIARLWDDADDGSAPAADPIDVLAGDQMWHITGQQKGRRSWSGAVQQRTCLI